VQALRLARTTTFQSRRRWTTALRAWRGNAASIAGAGRRANRCFAPGFSSNLVRPHRQVGEKDIKAVARI